MFVLVLAGAVSAKANVDYIERIQAHGAVLNGKVSQRSGHEAR